MLVSRERVAQTWRTESAIRSGSVACMPVSDRSKKARPRRPAGCAREIQTHDSSAAAGARGVLAKKRWVGAKASQQRRVRKVPTPQCSERAECELSNNGCEGCRSSSGLERVLVPRQ